MLVVTAGTGNHAFKDTILYNKDKCESFGYDFRVYDIGNLGFGIPFDDPRCNASVRNRRTKSAMKPELLLDAMDSSAEDMIVWIDGDATLIRPIDEIAQDISFDIGLTLRPKRVRKKAHYINAGVLFIRNNDSSRQFIRDWIGAFPETPVDLSLPPRNYSDQSTLEEQILLPSIDVPLSDLFGLTRTVHGARVKFFECRMYNNWWVWTGVKQTSPDPDTKVLHFKGIKMHRLKEYAKEFIDV